MTRLLLLHITVLSLICRHLFIFPDLIQQLPSDGLNPEEKENKFVYLKVDFGGFHSEERVLMVSFHSGYIFIQTDKPIYNPGDTGEDARRRRRNKQTAKHKLRERL